MTQIRLETLTRHGELDPGTGCSFYVDSKEYFSLPELCHDFSKDTCIKGEFQEVYRNHTSDKGSYHPQLVFKEEWPNEEWHIVWIEKESVWIAFKYADRVDADDLYTSLVEVSSPWHGEIHRISSGIAEILKKVFNMNCETKDVYKIAP
jgi:hypothetical protein